ncbi:hypothetical protein JMG10_28200 [Nostoc ellipsosporum NOK]|nr:hypothetical protein [Nostoc ellipsosporum NOK]
MGKKKETKTKQHTVSNSKVREYEDYPAFSEKTKADRQFLEKYGLPKELQEKYGFKGM